MNRSLLPLGVLYLATSAGLAWTTVLECRYGPLWAACLFAAASLVPVVALVRECEIRDLRRELAESHRRVPAPRTMPADVIVRAELDAACCERWWTSFGSDHDTMCPRRLRRSSAA